MNLHFLRLVISIAIVFLSFTVHAKVSISEPAIVYYDLYGSTYDEIYQEVNTKDSPDRYGTRRYGFTKWNVAWNYNYESTWRGCRLTDISVTVSGTITLPRWSWSPRAANSLDKEWRRFVKALRAHEDGHYNHGISAAKEIGDLKQPFWSLGGCASVGDDFNKKAYKIIEKYNEMDFAYDRETDYGRTQGAQLPMPHQWSAVNSRSRSAKQPHSFITWQYVLFSIFVIILISILFLGILGMGIFYFAAGLSGFKLGSSSKYWSVAMGHIVSSTLMYNRGCWAKVSYSYMVNAQLFTGTLVGFLKKCGEALTSGSEDTARVILNSYPQGKMVQVYYHPERPSICVLEPGLNFSGILFGLIFGALMIGFSLWMIWISIIRYSHEFF